MNNVERTQLMTTVRQEIEHEQDKRLALLASLERADAKGQYDLIISAKWLPGRQADTIAYVMKKLREHVGQTEAAALFARIIPLRTNTPFVEETIRRYKHRPFYPPKVRMVATGGTDTVTIAGIEISWMVVFVADPAEV